MSRITVKRSGWKGGMTQVNFRTTPKLAQALKVFAAQNRVPAQDIIAAGVREALKRGIRVAA